jgi:hypothetical protein
VGRPARILIAAALAALAPLAAFANDSTAAFAAGGIRLETSDAIAMAEETLAIARDRVDVRYVFANRSASDIETLVAFPLPAIDLASYAEVPIQPPADDPLNFVGFTVSVDGAPVTPALATRATLQGRDVTAALADRGIPVSLFDETLYPKLLALPEAERAAMEAETLAYYEPEYDSVYPQWVQESTFAWTQTFPAGRETIVEHTYGPVVGNRFVSDYTLARDNADEAAWLARYCVDEADKAAIAALLDAYAASGHDRLAVVDEIGYVLSTGANWAGPIGRFRLGIDAGDPGNLLFTCMPDLARDADGRYVFESSDFVPEGDLWLLIVRRDPES